MNILITNCIVLPMTAHGAETQYFKGNVGVKNNRIALVSSESDAAQAFERECGSNLRKIDGQGKLVMPGLINIHNHASMTLMRSYADDIPLMKWLTDYIWPFEAKLTRDDVKLGAEVGIAEMLLGGTTTFVDMYWHQEAVAEAVEQTGIRAVLSPTFTDMHWEAFERDFKIVSERYGSAEHSRIRLMVAPHAPYSCSIEHLQEAMNLADKYGVGINIHVAETRDEVAQVFQRYGKTPMEHLHDLGLLTPRTLAVHSVHLTDNDIDILRRTGASVAHNPQSNMKISSGVSPVARLMAEGINVGIGTDGPCSNNDLDMWDEMRSASMLQKLATENPCVLPAYEVVRMATVCGAKAIGMEGELGVIKQGALADIIILDMVKPHLYPQHDIIANLVYCVKSSDVQTVIVDGEILAEQGKLLRQDVKSLCERAQRCVEDIAKR